MFSFILAFSVSIAVGLLLAWHTYLIATAQTTIEWYNNHMFKQEAKKRGQVYDALPCTTPGGHRR